MLQEKPAESALNVGQDETQKQVGRFLFSPDKEFSITGPAGTGKTHLMRYIADHTLEDYKKTATLLGQKAQDYEIILTATTNKAAQVLAESTGLPTSTIHSHLSLKVVDDYKTGKSKITKTNQWKVLSNQLIFVDEASMVDSELYDLLHAGTDNTCKIIYLGDHCQMAPVFEEISPVYRNPKHTAELTQPMRNAGQPALVDLCNRLRETVETHQFFQIDEVPGVIDYVDAQGAEDFITATFSHENGDARMLAYSNQRVNEFLGFTRQLKGYPDTLTQGETVINNAGILMGRHMMNVEADYFVKSVSLAVEEDVLDKSDPNAIIEYYSVVLTKGPAEITVPVPVDRDHLKSLSRYYARQKNWAAYYHIKNKYPDLRGRDACTVYKAQGSTYDTVFIDLQNIGGCTNVSQLARMLYVAASRAQNRLVLFGQLPPRLFK